MSKLTEHVKFCITAKMLAVSNMGCEHNFNDELADNPEAKKTFSVDTVLHGFEQTANDFYGELGQEGVDGFYDEAKDFLKGLKKGEKYYLSCMDEINWDSWDDGQIVSAKLDVS